MADRESETRANFLLTTRLRAQSGNDTLRVMSIRWSATDTLKNALSVELQYDNPDGSWQPLGWFTVNLKSAHPGTKSCLDDDVVADCALAFDCSLLPPPSSGPDATGG